ncbi:hypothetical protein AB6A40_007762 [Gnathostoma spinigerum]|uniref:Uncharacterized protein n=1 Tax=Gnathostoma spinigerum TaxID=75299 RepID=A0ABD6EM56_9BILA
MLRYICIFEARNDHSLSALKESHEHMMAEQREHCEYEIAIVRKEQKEELEEEKEANRVALDVVQQEHEAEFKNLSEELRHHSCADTTMGACQASTSLECRHDAQVRTERHN